MRRFLRRRRPIDPAAVSFCERCGAVCDARCRADTLREQAKASAVAYQAGLR
jgi:hypothetical protein